MIIKKNVLVLATALALGLAANAHAAELRFSNNPVQGQYIVVLKENVAALSTERSSAPRVSVLASNMASLHGVKVTRSFNHALRGFVVTANDRALAGLLMDDRVAYVEEDGYMYASATQTGATWGIDRVDQRALPLNSSYTYNTNASSVHAYIIDTGVLGTHTQFSGRMGNGYTAITDANGTNDCNGHGTHVAGTVGGTTYGVAKGVTIHPVRVLGCNGSGTNSGVIAGMDWVTANHVKPAVANMSLGGGASTATDDAVARMTAAGVVVAVAAGNDNGNACSYSPARAASAITVGSTTKTDARSSFSNFGTCLDIYAPGSSILSAWYTSTSATNTISGTSMASPHVAGAAALYLADNPTATPAQVTSALSASATNGVVTDAKTGSPNKLLYTLGGSGGNVAPTANFSSSTSGLTVTFTDGSSDSDGSIASRSWNFGDSTTSTATNPSKTYAAAGTYSVSLTVTDNGGATNTVTKSVTVATGNTQTYTNTTDYAIADNTTVDSPITVSGRTGNAPSTTSVTVAIVHTYQGDLKVDLVAPDGSLYNIHNRTGAGTDNINKTVTLNLSTETLNGTWKLRVNDNAAADVGRIDSWSITF
jgi:subtilisin family serine protease